MLVVFFYDAPATAQIYTLSLHDALPISDAYVGSGAADHWALRAGTDPSKYAKDRKSTRLNSSHLGISYAVFCLKKKRGVGDTGHDGRHGHTGEDARPSQPLQRTQAGPRP